MSDLVLLNLLNELRKSNGFNKFNNTGTRMLDSINHMTLKSNKKCIFGVKISRFCHLLSNIIMNAIM